MKTLPFSLVDCGAALSPQAVANIRPTRTIPTPPLLSGNPLPKNPKSPPYLPAPVMPELAKANATGLGLSLLARHLVGTAHAAEANPVPRSITDTLTSILNQAHLSAQDAMIYTATAAAAAMAIGIVEITRPKTTQPPSWWNRLGMGALTATAVAVPIVLTYLGLDHRLFVEPAANIAVPVAAWLASLGLGGYYATAVHKINGWLSSESAKAMASLDKLIPEGQTDAIRSIRKRADERRETLSGLLGQTSKSDKKVTYQGRQITTAEINKLLAFDGLVIVRADLAINGLETKGTGRIGGKTPVQWQEAIGAEEQKAIATHFEGNMQLILDEMETGLKEQDQEVSRISGLLEAFEAVTPTVFGSEMTHRLQQATEINQYLVNEVAKEKTLFRDAVSAMRGRMHDYLYSTRADYKVHSDHRDSLSHLVSGIVSQVVNQAREIDNHLRGAVSEWENHASYERLAHANKNVLVTKWRTNSSGQQESYTEYEDQSMPYEILAMSAASSARSHGEAARAGQQALGPLVSVLISDPVFQAENLYSMLPAGVASGVADPDGHGILEMFVPGIFSFSNNLSAIAAAKTAVSRFYPILTRLEGVSSALESRRNSETEWMNNEVTLVLAEQKRVALVIKAKD